MKKTFLAVVVISLILTSLSFAQRKVLPPTITPIRATDCSGFVAEGLMCWDTDDDKLYVGNGTTVTEIASLLANRIFDALAPISIGTSTPISVGATYLTSYHFNQHATPATGITYNLPVAATGKQYIIKNSHGAGGANTGILTVHPVTSSYINYNGTNCTVSYDLVSAGEAGDYIAIVGIDDTHWEVVGSKGTWTCTAP